MDHIYIQPFIYSYGACFYLKADPVQIWSRSSRIQSRQNPDLWSWGFGSLLKVPKLALWHFWNLNSFLQLRTNCWGTVWLPIDRPYTHNDGKMSKQGCRVNTLRVSSGALQPRSWDSTVITSSNMNTFLKIHFGQVLVKLKAVKQRVKPWPNG